MHLRRLIRWYLKFSRRIVFCCNYPYPAGKKQQNTNSIADQGRSPCHPDIPKNRNQFSKLLDFIIKSSDLIHNVPYIPDPGYGKILLRDINKAYQKIPDSDRGQVQKSSEAYLPCCFGNFLDFTLFISSCDTDNGCLPDTQHEQEIEACQI